MLLELLPDRIQKAEETKAYENAMEPSVIDAQSAKDDTLAQVFLETATWGLDLWEKQLGLETEAEKNLEYRRSRIKSKLRGQGTATIAMIQNLSESFSGGETEIIEHPEQYSFDIKFCGSVGTPPNLDDLTAALNETIPAHLSYQYQYRYLLIREIHGVMTISEIMQTEIDKFARRTTNG